MSQASTDNIRRLKSSEDFIQDRVREISESEKVLAPWKKRINKYNDLYKMIQTSRNYQGIANIFVPELLRAVETVTRNIYDALVGASPWFEYVGREDSDKGAAVAHTQLVSYQMDENGFKEKLMDSIRQMVISGVTVRKVLWDFEQIERIGKEKKDDIVQTLPQLQTIKDVWTFEPVDLVSFHISDIATPYNDIQRARWIAEQRKVERHYIKDKIKKDWYSNEQFKLLEVGEKPIESDASRFKDARENSSGYSTGSKSSDGIELIERWGLLPAELVYSPEEMKLKELEADDLVETVCVIANRKAILMLEANPFYHKRKPYLSCPYIPVEFNWAGIGSCQIGEKLQEELNDTRNQLMDNKSLALNTMWLKSRASGINNEHLRIRPNGVIPTNDMNGLVALRPPLLSGVGLNIEGTIKNDIRESIGATSNVQGIATPGVDTATESSILSRESSGRLKFTAELYANIILKPLFIMVEYLNYQFYDTLKVIKIVGNVGVKFVKLDPNQIAGNKDVIIYLNVDADENPSVKRQQMIQFFGMVQPLPIPVIQQHWDLLNDIYKSLFPGKDLSDVYPVPADKEELLTPDEEFDLMLAGLPAKVHMGDNDAEHLAKHHQDYESTKYSVEDTTLKLEQDHIMGHEMQQAQKQMAQMQQQIAAMAPPEAGPGGKSTPPGQMAETGPFTSGQPKNDAELARNMHTNL